MPLAHDRIRAKGIDAARRDVRPTSVRTAQSPVAGGVPASFGHVRIPVASRVFSKPCAAVRFRASSPAAAIPGVPHGMAERVNLANKRYGHARDACAGISNKPSLTRSRLYLIDILVFFKLTMD
jgi:hypothetical protein